MLSTETRQVLSLKNSRPQAARKRSPWRKSRSMWPCVAPPGNLVRRYAGRKPSGWPRLAPETAMCVGLSQVDVDESQILSPNYLGFPARARLFGFGVRIDDDGHPCRATEGKPEGRGCRCSPSRCVVISAAAAPFAALLRARSAWSRRRATQGLAGKRGPLRQRP